MFDFSNYPEDSKFSDLTNKKVIGEFAGLKSKIHSMKIIDGKESNTAKGVNIATEFKEFKDTLFNKEITRKKPIKWEHTKSAKYHYRVLMIKELSSMMVFIHLLIFIKELKE